VVSRLFRRVGQQVRQPMWWVPVVGACVAYYRHRRTAQRGKAEADDVGAVAAIIRRKLDAGLLPREPPKSLQAGRGDGSACSACDRPIRREDHEWSFWANGVVTHRFHVACHRLWEAECRTRGWHGGRPRRGSRDRDA
jgi:hypothetical protein